MAVQGLSIEHSFAQKVVQGKPVQDFSQQAVRRLALMGQMNRTVVNNIPAFGQDILHPHLD